MPLPLLLLGAAAVVSGVFGGKKIWDAKSSLDSKNRLNEKSQSSVEKAQASLMLERDNTKNALFQLGELKKTLYTNSLETFVAYFSRIKNVNFHDRSLLNELQVEFSTADDIQHLIQESTFSIQDLAGGSIAALGAGGIVGLATYGGVGLAGTASTGTAIATLNGVALTNATLAWLGGGSLAAGGLGVAGGMAILGGIVAAPVLAIGGTFLSSKAEVALEEARANASKAELIVEELKASEIKVRRLRFKFTEVTEVLTALEERFKPLLDYLPELTARESIRQKQTFTDFILSARKALEDLEFANEAYKKSAASYRQKIKYLFTKNKYLLELDRTVADLLKLNDFPYFKQLVGVEFHFNGHASNSDKLEVFIADQREKLDNLKYEQRHGDKIIYDLLSTQDKKAIHITSSLAVTIKKIMEIQLLSDDGDLSQESNDISAMAEQAQTNLDS